MQFLPSPVCRLALAAGSALLLCPAALAASCLDAGLAKRSGMIMQIREAGQPERPATVYRDAAGQAWFVPLQQGQTGPGGVERLSCTLDGASYWKLAASDPALQHDAAHDVLSFLDIHRVTAVIEGRPLAQRPEAETLGSAGVNYQLALNYQGSYAANSSSSQFNPSALGDFYAYRGGWYANTSLGWSNNGKIVRYQSYALKESLDSGTFLRLGDAVSKPTLVGESLQFAGVSWGTDRSLRPYDYSPVLPTLRNGNVLAGPLEVFINDTLQFQQTLQNGVFDLRNLPAQQGFNSYSVRTLDAQGNPVTVQREIYLPTSLLPPGIASWRVDAGFQREDFIVANAHYGAPFVAASYARGLSHDLTLGGQALLGKAASSVGLEADQRLSDLWTGHLGLLAANNTQQQGHALQARIEGGSRAWHLLADWTHAGKPLPGLGNRAALLMQRLLRAQWHGIPGWNLGLTLAQSQRERLAREDIASLMASTRAWDSASVVLGLTETRANASRQRSLTVSLFVPLAPGEDHRNRSFYASQNSIDGLQLSRAQYSSSGQARQDPSWNVGATRDARDALSALDASWSRSTDRLELMASGRAGQNDFSGQLSLRSGLIWTAGSVFGTRPINGAFAMVSTGEPGVEVFHENRPVGQTDARGLLLVPDLRALEANRLTLDPASWPLHWIASEVERQVVPPRGGGVLVSFRINAQVWPTQTMITPLSASGKPYPSGTVVHAGGVDDPRESVIDRRGQLWIAELLPAASFRISQGGQRCSYAMPQAQASGQAVIVVPAQCEDRP